MGCQNVLTGWRDWEQSSLVSGRKEGSAELLMIDRTETKLELATPF